MDEDLAFCLARFIDEQVQLIDNRIKSIDNEKEKVIDKVQREKRQSERQKIQPKDKGSHERDECLVNRFIEELRRIDETPETETIIDDPHCVDALRAELSTKLGASSVYLNRLRNVAQALPKTKKFIVDCDETIDYCRRTKLFDEHFQSLCDILRESTEENIAKNTQKWWRNTYGLKIFEINRQNVKINPVLTENHYETLSSTSRAISHTKRLIQLRTVMITKPSRDETVRRFVDELYSLDDEQRERKSSTDLIDDLLHEDIKQNIDFAQRWLNHRDKIRNEKDVDLYEEKLRETQAEFGRRKICQQAKKLALAGLLCRLAVGSTNDQQFEEKLQKTIDDEVKENRDGFAVVSGDLKDNEEIPIVLRLDMDEKSLNQWDIDEKESRDKFANDLCKAFGIPSEKIRIDRIELIEGFIHLRVTPAYGKIVVDCLNGNAADAVDRRAAVRKCFAKFNVKVETLTLGEFDLEIDEKLMDPQWNKIYAWPNENDEEKVFWSKAINQGNRPYFCPSGWKRYGVKVAKDEKEFDEKWGTWNIAYHGTRGEYATNILTSGLRVSLSGCFYEEGEARVYVSPSIEYCAHPRYAYPWRKSEKNGEEFWYQLVFQCRVNPMSIAKICPETLINPEKKNSIRVDPNFNNNELEWIILGQKSIEYIKDDIICYGLMMRVSSIDPSLLPTSSWWKHTSFADIYKKS